MQFESLSEFFAMGTHGLYVWLAYGATTLVLLAFPVLAGVSQRRVLRELRWQVPRDEEIPGKGDRSEDREKNRGREDGDDYS
ncbi:MAG: heme exporter protein CcmD [Pseudomonadales bacterium]